MQMCATRPGGSQLFARSCGRFVAIGRCTPPSLACHLCRVVFATSVPTASAAARTGDTTVAATCKQSAMESLWTITQFLLGSMRIQQQGRPSVPQTTSLQHLSTVAIEESCHALRPLCALDSGHLEACNFLLLESKALPPWQCSVLPVSVLRIIEKTFMWTFNGILSA